MLNSIESQRNLIIVVGKANKEWYTILGKYTLEFLEKYGSKIHPIQMKVLNDIVHCRTNYLGGRIAECDSCKEKFNLYFSCKNRHYPQYITIAKEKWLLAQKNNILSVKYYHIIFTIPHDLNSLIYSNQQVLLQLFFKTVGDTLTHLALDPKFIAAKIGILSILHTWDQRLQYHPHNYCRIPTSDLNPDKTKWIEPKNDKYFIPGAVIAENFAFDERFNNKIYWNTFISCLYDKQWNVKAINPYIKSDSVIDNFGRYYHKVAISNFKVLILEKGYVYFRARNKKISLTLSG